MVTTVIATAFTIAVLNMSRISGRKIKLAIVIATIPVSATIQISNP
jgi:hypothetical protein